MVRVGPGFGREAWISLPAGYNGDAARKSSAMEKVPCRTLDDDFLPGEQFYVWRGLAPPGL
jgi:hypothetical protein